MHMKERVYEVFFVLCISQLIACSSQDGIQTSYIGINVAREGFSMSIWPYLPCVWLKMVLMTEKWAATQFTSIVIICGYNAWQNSGL